jgi:hypothetical protein
MCKTIIGAGIRMFISIITWDDAVEGCSFIPTLRHRG